MCLETVGVKTVGGGRRKECNDSHLGSTLPPLAAMYSTGTVLTHTGDLRGTLITEF